jgi:hypothetical protein
MISLMNVKKEDVEMIDVSTPEKDIRTTVPLAIKSKPAPKISI